MNCRYCKSENVVKNGYQPNGCQKYHCRNCLRYFQKNYTYQAAITDDKQIIILTKEGCGIRSIGRILNISPFTVIRRIKKIASKLERPYPILKGKIYEVDELFTYVKNKCNRVCVAYSYEPKTGYVLDISVGTRCKQTLRRVTDTLILSEAKTVYTDGLDLYKQLIPENIHKKHRRCTNHIERQNLTLRTHLKRLNRRTICFSKSMVMLLAVVKIYFWCLF
jgi:insertion element IS1 protein InsB